MTAPKKNKSKTQPPATIQNFPIVGIGASAGGLDAFKRLLKAIPEDSGMAYVLVQHLDPSHESILPEILQRETKIPVHEISDDIHLAPNHIYIIPANKILTSTDGVLQITPRDKSILNLSIDIFFKSLADVHKEFAVGIVLSGNGSDGTLGLKAIKENGGISMAQDSESAAYDSMPQSAVNAGFVDFILAPEKIPAQLLQINSAYKTNHFFKEVEHLQDDEDGIFKQILILVRERSGIDFSNYKQPTFHRRIARRIAIVKKKNLIDYLKYLRTHKAEQDALFQDVLIPVTSFFRDPKTFKALTESVFPTFIKNRTTDEAIRIWIAGCSTGEEAYSIAISLHEFLGDKLSDIKIQIFASDISEKAIKKARLAIYSKAEVEILSDLQLKNYFIKNNGGYEVTKLIRDMCIFAPHNFLKDPPFAKIDLITCRNVLIYMDTFLQKKAFTTFHYALKENGFLLLGKSETIGASSDLFTHVSKHEKIYSRKPISGRFIHVATERKEEALTSKDKSINKQETVYIDFRKSAEEIMISKSPASVVVNEQMDIVHIHGDITPFLQAPQGKPTHNLIKMAREGLAFELRNAIHKASKQQASVIKEKIPMTTNDVQSVVTIEIIPLTNTIELHYLIRFKKKSHTVQVDEKPTSGDMNETQKQNLQLERELSQTREDMRAITEDMEAANEELQSANEELQSSNEEMQSLNEELETSKEELQSTNEELTTVNQELIDKQEQLNTAHYYAESIVATMREPLIILDRTLRIKTANEAFYKKFNATEQDTEGALFYEIQNRQWDDKVMRNLLEKILPNKERLTDYEIVIKFPKLGERTMLLNAQQIINEKNNELLFLLAIEDISEQTKALNKIEISENRFKMAIKASGHVAFTQDENLKHTWIYNSIPNFSAKDILGKDDSEIHEPETAKRLMALKKQVLQSGIGIQSDVLVTINGEQLFYEILIDPILNDKGITIGVTGVAMDVTEKVVASRKIEETAELSQKASISANEAKIKAEKATIIAEHAVKSKQQFLSNMSHEIRTPMNAIIGFTKVLMKSQLTEKQREYLDAIKSSGNTLVVLINDILDLAKVDAGKMIFLKEPFKISDSVTTIIHLFETKIQEKNLLLVKEFDDRIPKILLGDSIRLHQILINLLSNAIKFTAKGKILVGVNLLSENEEEVSIEIKITDTGIGIPENKIHAIFENFEQAHTITSSLYGGTGLGLAIVKQLVEKQGGTISVKSKIKEGSTFSFTMTFKKTNDQMILETEFDQYENIIKPINVLVVEDMKLNQLLLRTILEDFKFECDVAENGEIAIEKLKTNSYDIILMDLQMPIMNGFEATENIRNKMNLQTPIIALTADVTTVDEEKCKAIGMNDYISKPLDEKLLYSKISDLIKNK
ncbi:MAG: chemotaxis protein CheB [bacterium]|nr:chemotaxis protein CheB [bacterium]